MAACSAVGLGSLGLLGPDPRGPQGRGVAAGRHVREDAAQRRQSRRQAVAGAARGPCGRKGPGVRRVRQRRGRSPRGQQGCP